MAATDISALVAPAKAPYQFQSVYETAIFDIDVTKAAFAGIETVETHKLVPIPLGKALVGGYAVVLTSFASTGNATVVFQVGSETLTGTLPKADLAKGDVIRLSVGDKEDTAGAATYSHTEADTLDWVVGTEVLTAGRVLLYLDFVNVLAATTNG